MLETRPEYKFFKQPFAFLFLALASGIFIASNYELKQLYYLLTLFFGILLVINELAASERKILFLPLLFFTMMFSGAMLYSERSADSNTNHFIQRYAPGDLYKVIIEDVAPGDGSWMRCIGRITHKLSGSRFEKEKGRILIFIERTNVNPGIGDEIITTAEVSRIQNKGNPGEFDAEYFWKSKGINLIAFASEDDFEIFGHHERPYYAKIIDRVRNYCINTFDRFFEDQHSAVIKAVVLGDKSDLSAETKSSFMNTGAMHLLAVSGLHVGIILYMLMFIMERFSKFISRRTSLITLLVLLWFYALLTGMSPSVIRAVFMFTLLSVSQLVYRNYNPINVLFFSAFCILLYDPLYFFDIGFQLSYLAMLGIFLFYGPVAGIFTIQNKWLRKVWEGTAIGLAAQLLTTPLSLYYFHQFPNYFILSNLGLMAFSGLILGLGIAILLIAKVNIIVSPIVFVVSYLMFLTLWFLGWIEKLPGAVAYGYELNWIQMALILSSLALFFFLKNNRARYLSFILMITGVVWLSLGRYNNMALSELCIFNHNRTLITLKEKGTIHCFHDTAEEKDFKKIKFILSGYTNIYPGKIVYHKINSTNIRFHSNHNDLLISKANDGYRLVLNNKLLSLKYFIDDFGDTGNNTNIGMPWVQNGVDFSLKSGAFRVML